ncbi:MAG: LytTR family DNA-binding domain-containing protein [Acutalibacteraceae bacterium]
MNVRFRFLEDDTVDGIEVIVRAKNKDPQVEALLVKLAEDSKELIPGHAFNEKYGINIDDVIHLMRDGRYVTATTVDGEHIIKDALSQTEELLDPVWFVRISQSEIINLRYLEHWDFVSGGFIQIRMEKGIICYTSRRYTTQIREKILKRRGKR